MPAFAFALQATCDARFRLRISQCWELLSFGCDRSRSERAVSANAGESRRFTEAAKFAKWMRARTPTVRAIIVLLPGVILGVLANVSISIAAEAARSPAVVVVDEPTVLDAPVIVDDPAFPGIVPRKPVRLWGGSFVAPEAGFGDSDITLVRPAIRGRASPPLSALAALQITADFSTSFYELEDGDTLFPDCPACPDPDDLYSVALATQGGYRLNDDGHLLLRDEQWAVLGTLVVRARWEPGAFSESVTPGASFSLGYQLPGRLRLALGATVERALDGDGVAVGPLAYLRWDLLPQVRLKSRGLGGQLEYQPNQRFDFFVTAFRNSDSFRLNDRPDLPSGVTFQDRQLLVGTGMVLKAIHGLRLLAEVGAIVDRRVSISTRDDGRIESRSGDPSPYFDLRLEGRI